MTIPVADSKQAEAFEEERLRRLELYGILRTPPEPAFDSIARLAAGLLEAPIAYLCMTGAKSHWLKGRIGLDLQEIGRSAGLCDRTLACQDVMVVPDRSSKRFCN